VDVQFGLFPLKHVGSFHQLEHDLALLDPAMLLRSPALDKTTCEQMKMTTEDAEVEASKIAEWIKKCRAKTDPVWDREMWALNVEGLQKWRSEQIKNLKRDALVLAKLALNENRVAMNYRPGLLESSQAARWLRQEFKAALDPLCSAWKVELDGVLSMKREYMFPDLLGTATPQEEPTVDLNALKKARAVSEQEQKGVKEFAALMGRLQRTKYFHATLTSNALDDDVRLALDMLAKVHSSGHHLAMN
jgi:hypothetical protein